MKNLGKVSFIKMLKLLKIQNFFGEGERMKQEKTTFLDRFFSEETVF